MTARYRANRLLTRIALRDDRGLYLRWPAPVKTSNRRTPLMPASSHDIIIAPASSSPIRTGKSARRFTRARWGRISGYPSSAPSSAIMSASTTNPMPRPSSTSSRSGSITIIACILIAHSAIDHRASLSTAQPKRAGPAFRGQQHQRLDDRRAAQMVSRDLAHSHLP